jgi:hypothetical protein
MVALFTAYPVEMTVIYIGVCALLAWAVVSARKRGKR